MKQLKVTRSHICGFSFMARRVKSVTNHAGVMRQNGKLKASAAHVSIELLKVEFLTLVRNASHRCGPFLLQFLGPMANPKLSPTRKHYRIGDKDDYVVLDGVRLVGKRRL